MMREKYESLAVHDLKEIARSRGIKGVSAMKKADVIEAMLLLDAESGADQRETKQETKPETKQEAKAETVRTEGKRREAAAQEEGSRRGAQASRRPRPQRTERADRPQDRQQERQQDRQQDSQQERPQERAERAGMGERGEHERERAERSERPEQRHDRQDRQERQEPGESRYGGARGAQAGGAEEEKFPAELDSGTTVSGILEVLSDGYGFIRSANYMPGENDVYVAPSQIRRFGLKTGDILEGNTRVRTQNEKFSALLYVRSINGYAPDLAARRMNFEDMTPIFPDSRLKMEKYGSSLAMRIMDLLSPIGKGQRGMIVSPPKAGKTTLLKEVAQSVKRNYPDMHLIILLIDERPEEVTDMRETVEGPNVEVIYSTFDELPDHHKRVSEMVIERAKRLVEHKKDVMILLDSITRLTRAYNLVVPPSGRTLSGGIDPAALHMPKRFFGAARNMREGGSLTILATALVDTGSKMDDVIYEEFKGTGNMELVLDRKLSEKRLFPAIDIPKTSTRREDLLLSTEEMEAINIVRRTLNGMKSDEAVDRILDLFSKTRSNAEFVQTVKKMRYI